ncbi:hypothetical protein D9M71_809000 [compost metagenome]
MCITELALQLGAAPSEAVRDVLEKDQAEDDVFVFGGIHVGAHFIGGGPQSFFQVLQGTIGLRIDGSASPLLFQRFRCFGGCGLY